MKLNEFLDNINKMVENDPNLLELTVVTAIDSEGNGFEEVYYTPSPGVYIKREFHQLNDDEEDDYGYTVDDINAICIN